MQHAPDDPSKAEQLDPQQRAAARRGWQIRRFERHRQPADDLSRTTTPAERIAIVWQLTLDAWAMSGEPLPDYTRDRMPGRLIRPQGSVGPDGAADG